jgi:hypothetical protein
MDELEPPEVASNELVESLLNGGHVDLRKTHLNLWRMAFLLAVGELLLGANFLLLQPTYPIFHAPNELWGICFVVVAVSQMLALLVVHSLAFVRGCMSVAVAYTLIVAVGACEPWLDGVGSLQLAILYGGMAVIQIPLILEPFLNPMTNKS